MPSKEYEFLMKIKDLSPYEGRWIAVVGRNIIVGRTLKEAVSLAEKKFPQKRPLVMKVPKRGHYVL